jgi:hypothetical protein
MHAWEPATAWLLFVCCALLPCCFHCSANIHFLPTTLWLQVMANNNEMILLPVNEPTHGTKR